MRKKDKEIIDKTVIDNIINNAYICRIALAENNKPYIIPMSFGYNNNCIYLHTGKIGKKIDILKTNPLVCFEIEQDVEFKKTDTDIDCNWGMKYYSVIGFGTATFITQTQEIIKALNIIMHHYSEKSTFQYSEQGLENVCIIKIEIDEIFGKQAGH